MHSMTSLLSCRKREVHRYLHILSHWRYICMCFHRLAEFLRGGLQVYRWLSIAFLQWCTMDHLHIRPKGFHNHYVTSGGACAAILRIEKIGKSAFHSFEPRMYSNRAVSLVFAYTAWKRLPYAWQRRSKYANRPRCKRTIDDFVLVHVRISVMSGETNCKEPSASSSPVSVVLTAEDIPGAAYASPTSLMLCLRCDGGYCAGGCALWWTCSIPWLYWQWRGVAALVTLTRTFFPTCYWATQAHTWRLRPTELVNRLGSLSSLCSLRSGVLPFYRRSKSLP